MKSFNIAGLNIQVETLNIEKESRYDYLFDSFNVFKSIDVKVPDLKVTICSRDDTRIPEGESFYIEGHRWIKTRFSSPFETAIINNNSEAKGHNLCFLEVDRNWGNAVITSCKVSSDEIFAELVSLTDILFRNFILFHSGIVVHASAIQWEKKGLIFAAPTDTGKSTQSDLWKEYMGASVLNGDRSVVRLINGKTYVFGTPWSGSSEEFLNVSAKLEAIIILEKSQVNSISKLGSKESIQYFMPRCFLPFHDTRLMDIALLNIERIIAGVPVYLLKCRPDREAVDLVYQWVK